MKYIALLLTLLIFTTACDLPDDVDHLISSIGAKPVAVEVLAGEIGMSLGENPSASLKPASSKPTVESTAFRTINSMWISPGKVSINNTYRGLKIDNDIVIRNGSYAPAKFSIVARECDYLETGYTNIPLDWITVSSGEITIPSGESISVPITITIPKRIPSKQLEFWVGVKDITRAGMLKTELCSKWFINIR
jgi:hypothetical protein